jgi:hypothetical protein
MEWPWNESTGSVMPIEAQLSLLLGRRLEAQSVGGTKEPAQTEERPPGEGHPPADDDVE